MKMTYLQDEECIVEFAKRAAINFAKNPQHYTYTDGDIRSGFLFAMRFGLGDDCVVVFRIADDFEPVNFQELIRAYQQDA